MSELLKISIIPGCLEKSGNVGKWLVSQSTTQKEGGAACLNLLRRGNEKIGKLMQWIGQRGKDPENYKALLALLTTRRGRTSRKLGKASKNGRRLMGVDKCCQ